MQQATRKPFAIACSEWFRSPVDVYKPGNRLMLTFSERDRFTEVQIVKAFTPFTNSVALLVDAHSAVLPSRCILKLADRRAYSYWNPHQEEDYQSKIQPQISRFGTSIKLDPNEELLPWMYLFQSWERFEVSHFQECEAYRRLVEAQSLGFIPRFFRTAKIEMMDRASHPSLSYISGLLIEYVPRRSMALLRPGINITNEEAEVISQHILELGRRLRRYGVCNNDVHVGNIILRAGNKLPVLIDWGKASFDAADFPLPERWNFWDLRQDFYFDIRTVLRTGVYHEGPTNVSVYPDIPVGGVWHRYRTPVFDEEQIRLAQERGYRAVNRFIETFLSKEELDMLYDEDASVDINCGLRWKVKDGVKTGGFDDPCPTEGCIRKE
ncbi:hypothetical protein C0995_001679 [Termitomyces sp. Mi166|nr:hypothetical protein C0995_001679 [Termitomyces sp. Mi166\